MLESAYTRRIGLVALGLLGCAVATSFSLAMTTAKTSPRIAATLAPYLSQPKTKLAEILLPAAIESGETDAIRRIAQEAAALDPFSPDAIRTLALVERTDGHDDTANAMFAYANALTRRDIGVNLDYVMEAAKRGDAETMIRHFSIALRTNRGSWDRLFPIIYQASVSEEIAAPLARELATDPQWKWSFLDGLVRQGPDPLVTSHLFENMERTQPLDNDDLYRALIGRLIEAGHYNEALARNNWLVNRKNLKSLTNGDFERQPLNTAFEWADGVGSVVETAVANNTVSAELGKSLYFRIPTGADGELARVVALVPPGRHELSAVMGAPLQGEAGDLIFEAECLGSGATIERTVIRAPSAGHVSLPFTTPAGCSAVRLYIKVRTKSARSTWASWIDELKINKTDN